MGNTGSHNAEEQTIRFQLPSNKLVVGEVSNIAEVVRIYMELNENVPIS